MAFNVPTGAAYAVLYSILIFFTLLALGAAGWLPSCVEEPVSWCFRLGRNDQEFKNAKFLTTDHFLSARNAAGTWSIGLSFFASGMGAWVSINYLLVLLPT
jgi:hypothetical protein